MPTHRKLTLSLLLVVMLVAVPVAGAAPPIHDVSHFPVSWTLDHCSMLPAGLMVEGEGVMQSVLNIKDNADGSQRITFNDLAKGTATDNAGGTYQFVYHLHLVADVPPSGTPIQVAANDLFMLSGQGQAAGLNVGFHWRWTATALDAPDFYPPVTNWEQLSTKGDPLTCDPL
jgi:hypothetical protein